MGRGATAQSEAVVEKERNKKKKEMKKTYIIPEEKIAELEGADGILNRVSGDTEGGYYTNTDDGENGEEATVKAQNLWNTNW